MTEFNFSRAPRGVLAAQQLIAAAAEQGDLAERHYLELKSTLNLATKKDKEKIAKFILGAANRLPDVAATVFEGYGVMIIGVGKGSIVGIPPVEMMEISRVIQQYVGAAGPHWDILWAPIENNPNQVLVILVDPPKRGQGPFPCRANGESLTDGRVYVRADGETREAKADELDLLVQRGLDGAPRDVDFAVEVMGEVASASIDIANTLEEYLRSERLRLEVPLRKKKPKQPKGSTSPTVSGLDLVGVQAALSAATSLSSVMMEPEERTEQEYLDSIDRWEARFRSGWDQAFSKTIGSQFQPAIVKITNRTTTFFHDVELKLHLAGDISAVEYESHEYAKSIEDFDLPRPPREWGPRQRALGFDPGHLSAANLYTPSARPYIRPSIDYINEGSVTLNITVGELRPRGSFESENDELVLLVGDHKITTIKGSWELTARDHNDVYSGDITVKVGPTHDLTAEVRQILGLADIEIEAIQSRQREKLAE